TVQNWDPPTGTSMS
nr:immunoglobulin heavy chain junction region [Mus musculus]